MSGADVISYSTSAGVILNTPLSNDGVRARAEQLLDQRDRDHKDQFGHYPGEDPGCTQPSREAYRRAAEALATEPGTASSRTDAPLTKRRTSSSSWRHGSTSRTRRPTRRLRRRGRNWPRTWPR